jgi:CTP synthase (UTP-ammonia lyase)
MRSTIRVGVIGDYDGRASHVATNEAILNSANYLGVRQETQWISTDALESGSEQKLKGFDALWCAPGSPYKSAQGAMNAIQFARENNYPFIGTCGGFQHAVLEFARDVLNFPEVKELGFDPYSQNPFISSLSCSLAGETRKIYITEGTRTSKIYGRSEANEKYNCSFGLNTEFLNQLTGSGFKVSGMDETGEARILELSENKFFIATLFQPQLSSTPEKPHELILAFLKISI